MKWRIRFQSNDIDFTRNLGFYDYIWYFMKSYLQSKTTLDRIIWFNESFLRDIKNSLKFIKEQVCYMALEKLYYLETWKLSWTLPKKDWPKSLTFTA